MQNKNQNALCGGQYLKFWMGAAFWHIVKVLFHKQESDMSYQHLGGGGYSTSQTPSQNQCMVWNLERKFQYEIYMKKRQNRMKKHLSD